MSDQQERWAEMRDAIAHGMAAKGMSQADLVRTSGISAFTVRRLMRGEPGNYQPPILAKVSNALWSDGTRLRRILDGDDSGGQTRDQDEGHDIVLDAIAASPLLDDAGRRILRAAYREIVASAPDAVEHGERRADDPR